MKKLTKKKKHMLKVALIATGVSVLSISLVVGVLHAVFSREEPKANKQGIDYHQIQVARPEIEDAMLTVNINSRPGNLLEKVRGVVVHYTANPGTDAGANRNYFESRKDEPDKNKNKVSSHFIIGLRGNILCCVPENEIAYASNDRNADTLSIECCHPDKTGKFNPETYQSLVHLVAYLCDKYELKQNEIIRHYDVTGKACPKYMVDHPETWTKFKNDVVTYLKKSTKKTES